MISQEQGTLDDLKTDEINFQNQIKEMANHYAEKQRFTQVNFGRTAQIRIQNEFGQLRKSQDIVAFIKHKRHNNFSLTPSMTLSPMGQTIEDNSMESRHHTPKKKLNILDGKNDILNQPTQDNSPYKSSGCQCPDLAKTPNYFHQLRLSKETVSIP